MIHGISAQRPLPPPGIQFVGHKVISSGSGTISFDFSGLTGGIASSPQPGDFFIIFGAVGASGPDFTVASFPGLTGLSFWRRQDTIINLDARMSVWTGTYEAASASGGTYTINALAASALVTILVFRNCSGIGQQASNSAVAREINPPDVTPTKVGDWVLTLVSLTHQDDTQFYSIPSQYQIGYSYNRDAGKSITIALAIRKDPAIGSAFDPGFFNNTGIDNSQSRPVIGAAIVLRAS